jgi:hypothetical protein
MDEHEVHMWLRARLEAVAELAEWWRGWENVKNGAADTPPATAPHVFEAFVPQPGAIIDGIADGGTMETPGLYVVQVFGLAKQGDEGIRKVTRAILAAFGAGDGDTLETGRIHIKTNPAPYPGQIVPAGANKSRCTVTIPFYVHSINSLSTT